jgi:sugar phosphate isomerase/epimerase
MQGTDKSLVDFEMDMYWVITAGHDPVKWMDKYPGRFTLCHIKDRKKNARASDTDASTTVGTGQIDFASILNYAAKHGMQYYIVEQERYDNTTPLASIVESARYIHKNLF